MRGRDIIREIGNRQTPDDAFIRWWRRENDFADYELLDDFCRRVDANQEFEGFELLDIEAMWQTLKRLSPHHLARKKLNTGQIVIWEREGEDGTVKEDVRPYNAQTLMTIFDAETKGDTLV